MRNYVLGGAQLGRGYGFYEKVPELSTAQIASILQASYRLNVFEIDLAQNYEGVSENLAMQEQLTKFELSTKFRFIKGQEKTIISELKSSLKTLKKIKFSKVLVHNWYELDTREKKSSLRLLKTLKNDGICKMIGLSVYEPEELIDGVEETNFIQAPLSFLNVSFLNASNPFVLQSMGIEFQARSIFHQGTLLNPALIFDKFPEQFRLFTQYCSENSLSNLEGALSVYDQQRLFTSLVVGIASEVQLKEIIQTRLVTSTCVGSWQKSVFPRELTDPRLWK